MKFKDSRTGSDRNEMFLEIIGPFRTRIENFENWEPTRDENNEPIFGLIGRQSLVAVLDFQIPSSRPETRSLVTNHEGPGRKLGRP